MGVDSRLWSVWRSLEWRCGVLGASCMWIIRSGREIGEREGGGYGVMWRRTWWYGCGVEELDFVGGINLDTGGGGCWRLVGGGGGTAGDVGGLGEEIVDITKQDVVGRQTCIQTDTLTYTSMVWNCMMWQGWDVEQASTD